MINFDLNVSKEDEEFLLGLDQRIRSESSDLILRKKSSENNKKITDPIRKGSLIHGVRRFSMDVLESIINNGLLCPEFTNQIEDGEAFYHLGAFEAHVDGVVNWQRYMNDISNNLAERISCFMPSTFYPFNKRVGVIVNLNYDSKKMVRSGKKEELSDYEYARFINDNCIPLNYFNNKPNNVSVLGGIPSVMIQGFILSEGIDVSKFIDVLENKRFYAPVYNVVGDKVY